MRAFVLLSFVCLAVARPQYNYGQGISLQQSQFQAIAAAPSAAVANGQLDQSTIDILRQLPSVPTSPSTLLHESHQSLQSLQTNGGYSSAAPAFSAPQQAPQFASIPQFAFPQASLPLGPSPADIAPSHLAKGSSSSGSSASSFGASSSFAPLQLAPAQQAAPAQPSGLYQTAQFPDPITTIHKHIYVHIPPNEFEEELPAPRVRAEPANNQKHVQILFIKAPAPPTPKPIEFPPLGTNEEKTLVYVLVKKPEQPDEIVPPQTPEPKVNKPDVFFIKYQGENQPQGYGSDAPAGASAAVASDAIITNAASAAPSGSEQLSSSSASSISAPSAPAALSGPSAPAASEAEPLPLSASPSSASASASASSSSSSSASATPDREYIPAA